MSKSEKTQARTGGETAPERFLDRHLGNAVHLFLSMLAVLILVAAGIATIEVLIFVIARKMVIAGISGLDLLAGIAALAGLVAIRFYFIPSKDRKAQE